MHDLQSSAMAVRRHSGHMSPRPLGSLPLHNCQRHVVASCRKSCPRWRNGRLHRPQCTANLSRGSSFGRSDVHLGALISLLSSLSCVHCSAACSPGMSWCYRWQTAAVALPQMIGHHRGQGRQFSPWRLQSSALACGNAMKLGCISQCPRSGLLPRAGVRACFSWKSRCWLVTIAARLPQNWWGNRTA